MKNVSTKTVGMVQVALFAALIVIMSATPLGYIPLGFMRATIIHVPVILSSVLLGPKKGAILGFIFGLTSFVNNTLNPLITSFVFTPFYSLGEFSGGFGSIVTCFVPRILIGVFPWFVYRVLLKICKKPLLPLGVAGIIGSLTNTILVMGSILFFFKDSYAAAREVAADAIYKVIATTVVVNGIPEAIVAAILVAFVGRIFVSGKFIKM